MSGGNERDGGKWLMSSHGVAFVFFLEGGNQFFVLTLSMTTGYHFGQSQKPNICVAWIGSKTHKNVSTFRQSLFLRNVINSIISSVGCSIVVFFFE